jgi:hypothetical protein
MTTIICLVVNMTSNFLVWSGFDTSDALARCARVGLIDDIDVLGRLIIALLVSLRVLCLVYIIESWNTNDGNSILPV